MHGAIDASNMISGKRLSRWEESLHAEGQSIFLLVKYVYTMPGGKVSCLCKWIEAVYCMA